MGGKGNRLITIRFSHYNEKARWALDYFKIPYHEQGYLPMMHMPAVRWHAGSDSSRSDNISTSLSTPCLITSTGEVIADSRQITRWADASAGPSTSSTLTSPLGDGEGGVSSLYPDVVGDEVRRLEDYYHDRIGPNTRRAAYYFAFMNVDNFIDMADKSVGGLQASVFRLLWPLTGGQVKKGLGVSEKRSRKSIEHVRRELDSAAELLERNGTGYLVGDTFTAADLSFASMLGIAIMPSEEEGWGGGPLMDTAKLPPMAQDFVGEMRESLAGQHALRMYREHRGERVIPYGE